MNLRDNNLLQIVLWILVFRGYIDIGVDIDTNAAF